MNEGAFFQDLAVLMAVAGVVSAVFARLKWPKVIGYLLAGILMSRHTWGGSFLADEKSVTTIGQLGIVFLMYTLGLEFSASEMKRVKGVSIPTALFDVAVMMGLGYTVGVNVFGWSPAASLFLGAAVCDSATTLLAKTIDEMKWRRRPFVRYVFGTTVFEDVLCVGVIALVTGVARGGGMDFAAVGQSLGALAVFFVGVLVVGFAFLPRLLDGVAKMKDDEALILVMLGSCFFLSVLAFKFEFSLALGAFLVGILGASSAARDRLLALAAPLRSMFAAVFFVSIGLLVDPAACLRHLPAILFLAVLIVLGKGFNCTAMSLLTGQGVKDAVQTGFGLAQIGEFAFMVALLYMGLSGEVDSPMFQIVVGASLITTLLNPAMLRLSDPVGAWCEERLPVRVRGWLAAYGEWLARYRAAVVPSALQAHMRGRLTWIAVIGVLEIAAGVCALSLVRVDWSRFSAFFEAHDRLFFCFLFNLFCVSMLAPLDRLAHALGRDVATVIFGVRRPRAWRAAAAEVAIFAVRAAVALLAFGEIAVLNVNVAPRAPLERLALAVLPLLVLVICWKRFKRAGLRAGSHLNAALAAEARRADGCSDVDRDVTVHLPRDFYCTLSVPATSPALGRTLRELDVRAKTGASVVAVDRAGVRHRNPGPDWRFAADDQAVVMGEPAQTAAFRRLFGLATEAGAGKERA